MFKELKGVFIGSDESLKGDTFGGLVVAAVKADDQVRQQLIDMGVDDSKKLQDVAVIYLAEKIKNVAQYEVVAVLPEEYNQHKLTALLNKMHRQAAHALGAGIHVVDLYPGCTVGDIKETGAESKYPEVAAASILARAEALNQLHRLSKETGFAIPKGSTHVSEALQKLKASGLPPERFVKLHFRNVQKILQE